MQKFYYKIFIERINFKMSLTRKYGNIAFLSTYPPRECGLATFTQDLINAMDNIGIIDTNVIAVNNSEHNSYDSKVIASIGQNEQLDYLKIAQELNNSDIDLLVIEHEYGIFGGDYGDYIIDLVNNLDIPDEIIQYLQLSDIYMTPYIGKDQAVSGTMAYAVGYGKVIVSTPYLYAKEMLSDGRGLLAEFNNPDSMADCIKYILQNPDKKTKMERDTIKIGRTMYWDKVALRYTEVFLNILKSVPKIEVV